MSHTVVTAGNDSSKGVAPVSEFGSLLLNQRLKSPMFLRLSVEYFYGDQVVG